MKLNACSSYDASSGGYGPCKDGHPQISATCWGGSGGTPACLNEVLCARLYEKNGGKPRGALVNGHWDMKGQP